MKKYTKLVLTVFVLVAISNIAWADGNAFTPLDFEDSTSTTSSVPNTEPVKPKSSNPIAEAWSKVMPTKDVSSAELSGGEIPVGNESIQNAILELDNAQVGIRNDLLDYKAKYADVDAQYKLIKNERAMLRKQVKSIERRIRSIDRTKEKLRKNML